MSFMQLAPGQAVADSGTAWGGTGHGNGKLRGRVWMDGAAMLFNSLMGLGLLALVVAGVIFAGRWLARASGESPRDRSRDDALEIVRTRYARGEISREAFDRLRRELA